MESFRCLAAGLVMVAACVGAAAAQEPGQSPGPKPSSSASNEKPKLEGTNCTYGIACPIIGILVPDIQLERIKASPPWP